MTSERHLIIVPGHGIWKGTHDGTSPDDWFLEAFQYEGHDHLLFVEHIKRGLQALERDANAVLLFSGGQTKTLAGPISEAQSYYMLASKLGLLSNASLLDRISTEEFARDSFENVLFSFARYHELTGNYPTKVSIYGFEFKRVRFIDHHFRALKFEGKVNYYGIDPTPDYEKSSSQYKEYFTNLNNSEFKHAVSLFIQDPYGNGEILGAKKRKRNPFKRTHGYSVSNPKLEPILRENPNPTQDFRFPW